MAGFGPSLLFAPLDRLGSVRRATLAAALGGLVGGASLGALYRGWMRLVSTDPEFTWSGTVFIVGLVTVVTVPACLAYVARTRWRHRWARASMRALSGVLVLLLGAGQGMITVPAWVLGGLAIGRRGWPGWLRAVLALLAVASVVPLVLVTGADPARLGLLRFLAALVGYGGLMAVFALLFAVPFGDAAGLSHRAAGGAVDVPAPAPAPLVSP